MNASTESGGMSYFFSGFNAISILKYYYDIKPCYEKMPLHPGQDSNAFD
jgi:hypothetical protein